MTRAIRRRVGAVVFLFAPALAAQGKSTQAQQLFDEARELITDGKWADACPKLALSQQLDPRPTTLFRLAECHEHVGKKASAYLAYLASASAAQSAGETKRADFARDRAKKLEPVTPHLVISTTERPIFIQRDGEVLDESILGTRMPIDPGEHVIAAEAPGKQRFATTIVIADAATTVLTIPPLLPQPSNVEPDESVRVRTPASALPASARAPAVRPPPEDHKGLRLVSYVMAGVGGAGLITGGIITATADSSGEGCTGTCASGVGVMIGSGVITVTALAFFIASLTDDSPSPSPTPTRTSPGSPVLFRF